MQFVPKLNYKKVNMVMMGDLGRDGVKIWANNHDVISA